MVGNELTRWAMGTVNRPLYQGEYAGLSYEDASRHAQALCAAAAESGQTINATTHLVELTAIMTAARSKGA